MTKVQKHKDICKELNDVYAQKNHDYGDSFGETYRKLGIISAVTRISDKYNRLVSLATKPEEERQVKDESITDTLLDMANYCIMTVIELHKNENNKENNNSGTLEPCESYNHNWRYETTYYSPKDMCYIKKYICTQCGAVKTEEEPVITTT